MTALLFPGQGSQSVGMAKDFVENFRESALVFEEASDSIRLDIRKLCFEGPLETLTLTENLQPCLFTVEAAMFKAVQAHTAVEPRFVAGHSLGEYAALFAAGALSVADGARLTKLRGQAMQQAVPQGQGAMAAVMGLSDDLVTTLCSVASVEPANFNAPGQVVIAGKSENITMAISLLKGDPRFAGAKAIPLNVSAPFHCSLMTPAQNAMKSHLESTAFADLTCDVIPNVTADPMRSSNLLASNLLKQITAPVRWTQSMSVLAQHEVAAVWEIGPGRVLTGLHKRNCPQMPATSVSSVEILKQLRA
jgi:[acyl-carrier-protein] S-malonyltransferase